MDEELALLLYKQMILPVFDYCDVIIESANDTSVEELQTIQNHCLRCCLGIWDPRDITRIALHAQCDCKMLKNRRERSLLSRVYTISRNPENVTLPARELRNADKVKIKTQRPKGQLYRDSPLYRGSIVWDRLKGPHQRQDTRTKFLTEFDMLI